MSEKDSSEPAPPPAQLPFVGREAELKTIYARLRETLSGQGGGLAIKGESGLGKSRLVLEAAQYARSLGMVVANVPCRGTEHRPYQPLADLAYALLIGDIDLPTRDQRSRIKDALGALSLHELTPTFLELLGIPAVEPEVEVVTEEKSEDSATRGREALIDTLVHESMGAQLAKQQATQAGQGIDQTVIELSTDIKLPDALTRVLTTLAARQRASLLIFDDLDQTSDYARRVVQRLLAEAQSLPVFVLATSTSGPDIMMFGSDTLTLSPLSQEETTALVKIGGMNIALAEPIWKHTQGHPLFISLLVDHIGDAVWDGKLPSIHDIILKRIAELPESRRKALLSAAILGDGFRIGALRVLCEYPRDDALHEDLAALQQGGWLERAGKGRRAIYRFANRLVREALYKAMPDSLRVNLHGLAGDYYATPTAGRRVRTEQAVYHYIEAGKLGRALAAVDVGLILARREPNKARIKELYRLAIDIASRDPELTQKQAEYAEALGDLYAADGDYARAVEAYGKLGPTVSPISLLSKMGIALLAVDPNQAINVLTQIIPLVALDHPHDLRWRLEAALVWALAISGRTYEAIRRSRDTLGILSSTVGLGAPRTMMRGMLGMVLMYQGEYTEAHPHLESARAGWGARGEDEGVLLVNQALIEVPKADITRAWLRLILRPLLSSK